MHVQDSTQVLNKIPDILNSDSYTVAATESLRYKVETSLLDAWK